jgi:dolichyl-phosphate beta-glucosyltransferase
MESIINLLISSPLVLLSIVFLIIFLSVLAWLLQPLRTAYASRRSPVYDVENSFETGLLETPRLPFPSISDHASVLVSVVVPAYNEEKRIDPMMNEMIEFLSAQKKKDPSFTWEIIVVDDGSKDATSAHVQKRYVNVLGHQLIRVLKLFKNNGKGGAVRKGMLRARGEFIIFADADGATKASDLTALLNVLQKHIGGGGKGEKSNNAIGSGGAAAVAVGSRAHIDEAEESKAKRTAFRAFLHEGFDLLKRMLLGGMGGVRDTQCGFKMFTRPAVAKIFPVMHIERWAFDVELIYLAVRFGIPIFEVPVNWHEVGGSTLDPLSASLQMFRDVFIIRLCYLVGIWSDKDANSTGHVIASETTSPTSSSSSSSSSSSGQSGSLRKR